MANIVVKIMTPLINTQIRLLTKTKSIRSTLISTIKEWTLNYIGVPVDVIHLVNHCDHIQICLNVSQPEYCRDDDWQKIVQNIDPNDDKTQQSELTYASMTPPQQRKVEQLLAHLIHVGEPNESVNWGAICPQLETLDLDRSMLEGIKLALEDPQQLELLTSEVDPDIAIFVLSEGIKIALLDRHINADEDRLLSTLVDIMK